MTGLIIATYCIAATLERSNNLERKREYLPKKEEKKEEKGSGKIDKIRERKVWGRCEGGLLVVYDWCLGLML